MHMVGPHSTAVDSSEVWLQETVREPRLHGNVYRGPYNTYVSLFALNPNILGAGNCLIQLRMSYTYRVMHREDTCKMLVE